MRELDDNALLREYVEHDSEEAFATLVARHVNKVYSVALRLARNPHHAEEITQAVFVILARKARQLGRGVILSGWLCRTAHLAAVTHIRSEIRRARREQEAQMQTSLNEIESDVWLQVAPQLDDAMADLNENDHHAVVMRFFEGKSMKDVGASLGTSEDAAKQRVGRAVEKLRLLLARRGVVIPGVLLSSALSASSVQAAPPLLAQSVAAIAVAKGATASTSILALAEGTMKLMAWLKMKTPMLAAGTAAYAAGISMRELTLLETGCLCVGLLLCLVLPLMMSARPPKDPASRIWCLKMVWAGQAALAVAGLVVLLFEAAAVYATVVGAFVCIGCAGILWRHLRVARIPEAGAI